MEFNWYMIFVAALIPMIVGFIYYHPKAMGNIWMRVSEVTEEKLKTGNMAAIFGLSYLLSVFLSVALMGSVIHQMSILGMFEGVPGLGEAGSDVQNYLDDMMDKYGNNHRNFRHGMVHGGFLTVVFALPIIAINAMFERRGWKYIWTHFGYWFITLMLMGGVLCHFI